MTAAGLLAVLAACAPTTSNEPANGQAQHRPPPAGAPTPAPGVQPGPGEIPQEVFDAALNPPPSTPPPPCVDAPAYAAAAAENAASLHTLAFAPFRRPETGWDIYEPLVAHEIGTSCTPDRSGFAAALAQFQARFHLPADGRMTAPTFDVFKGVWQERRPFVMATLHGQCPDHPDQLSLVVPHRRESYGDKLIQLRRGALDAYRRMVAAARREVPEVAANPQTFQIYSGYRSPDMDDWRCQTENNCQGVVRAKCSAHRTALAMDIALPPAPGLRVDDSSDPNRRAMTQSAAYHWLVRNAGRFGFVPYAFEPWHWEWTGEAP
jgi:hypothetical protein